MLRQRNGIIDWFLVIVAAIIGFCCMCASVAQAQSAAIAANATASAPIGPILTSQLPPLNDPAAEPGIQSRAVHLYERSIRELHREKAARAEKDALRAVEIEPGFADAEALAATAALTQHQFIRARGEAQRAAQMDPQDAVAWVVLATADNYLARYAEAAAALNSMPLLNRRPWQASYQWARAEAGQNRAAETLLWANRTALTAPPGFPPLHLLRASALLAAGQYRQSAGELEIYLQLLGSHAPTRPALTRAV